MLRRLVCVLLSCGVLLGGASQRAVASENGAIRVTLGNGVKTVSSGTVTLYPAGEPVSGGYRLGADFGGGLVKTEDVSSSALAQWLAEQAVEGGNTRLLDADGNAEFSGLEAGLYLLVQREAVDGYYPILPFLVTLPEGEQWYLQTAPKMEELPTESPETGEHPAPIVAAMGLIVSALGLLALADRRNKRK